MRKLIVKVSRRLRNSETVMFLVHLTVLTVVAMLSVIWLER